MSEPYARAWAQRARVIMAVDAERRQSQIIFGRLPYQTSPFIGCVVTCVFSWKESDEETVTYQWFVNFGIVERGSHKLWLKRMPLRTSLNERRIRRCQDAYRTAVDKADFDSRTRALIGGPHVLRQRPCLCPHESSGHCRCCSCEKIMGIL